MNLFKREISLGIISLEAAIDFDYYSRNRYAKYDEAIFRVLLDYMINFRGIFTARPPYYSMNDISFFISSSDK